MKLPPTTRRNVRLWRNGGGRAAHDDGACLARYGRQIRLASAILPISVADQPTGGAGVSRWPAWPAERRWSATSTPVTSPSTSARACSSPRPSAGSWVASTGPRHLDASADLARAPGLRRGRHPHGRLRRRRTQPPVPDTPAIVAVTPLLHELLLALTDPMTPPPPELDRLRAVLGDRLRRTSHEPISLPAGTRPAVRTAPAPIALDPTSKRPMPLSALAEAACTTERTLSRLFHRETGMSYPQWRAQARAHPRHDPPRPGELVTDTANLCGWSTTSAFIDSFRRAMGQTPGAYRDLAGP